MSLRADRPRRERHRRALFGLRALLADGERQRDDLEWLVVLRIVAGLAVAAMGVIMVCGVPPLETYIDAPARYPYRGLEWVRALPPAELRALAAILVPTGAAMAAGLFYRLSATLTAAVSAYFFFIDSLYYTAISYLGVLLLVLLAASPAHAVFSLDARRRPVSRRGARVALAVTRFQIGCAYFFAGVAKWKTDWLSGRTLSVAIPDYGPARWVSLVPARSVFAGVSWAGMLFDLLIVPLLCLRATRRPAFVALVLFHVHNALALPVAVVPWFFLIASTVFLPPDWPRRCLRLAGRAERAGAIRPLDGAREALGPLMRALVAAWVTVQIALPLRCWVVPFDPHFHESGFRFAWVLRSRLKASVAVLVIVDRTTGVRERRPVGAGLSPLLAQRVAGDPYAIWRSAQDAARGRDVAVHAQTWVSLNGSPASPLVDPDVDLTREPFPLVGLPWWVRREPIAASR